MTLVDCKCEHWQSCPKCMPNLFDEAGHRLPVMPSPRREDIEAAGHQLALELECLLMDTKDLPTVSRWWSSGMEALDAWQKMFPYNGPRLGD